MTAMDIQFMDGPALNAHSFPVTPQIPSPTPPQPTVQRRSEARRAVVRSLMFERVLFLVGITLFLGGLVQKMLFESVRYDH